MVGEIHVRIQTMTEVDHFLVPLAKVPQSDSNFLLFLKPVYPVRNQSILIVLCVSNRSSQRLDLHSPSLSDRTEQFVNAGDLDTEACKVGCDRRNGDVNRKDGKDRECEEFHRCRWS